MNLSPFRETEQKIAPMLSVLTKAAFHAKDRIREKPPANWAISVRISERGCDGDCHVQRCCIGPLVTVVGD
jgi:hypothetical protein